MRCTASWCVAPSKMETSSSFLHSFLQDLGGGPRGDVGAVEWGGGFTSFPLLQQKQLWSQQKGGGLLDKSCNTYRDRPTDQEEPQDHRRHEKISGEEPPRGNED